MMNTEWVGPLCFRMAGRTRSRSGRTEAVNINAKFILVLVIFVEAVPSR